MGENRHFIEVLYKFWNIHKSRKPRNCKGKVTKNEIIK